MLHFTLIGLADAYPAADGNQFFNYINAYHDRIESASPYPSLGHSEVAFTNTMPAEPKGYRTGGLPTRGGCQKDAYVCPHTGITLQRDPNLNCQFDYSLCQVAPPLPDGRVQKLAPTSNDVSPDASRDRVQKVVPEIPDGRMQKQSDPSAVNASGDESPRCDTERNKAKLCLKKAKELNFGTWDVDWAFFSDELDRLEDIELYIRGCYVYTTGRLQGKAFYGGDGAKAPTDRVKMIDYECSGSEAAGTTVANKKTRAKSGSPTVGAGAPPSSRMAQPGHKGGKGVNPAWIIIPAAFGLFLIVAGGLCVRKKGCRTRGKNGYDAPKDAEKTDAQMDSVEYTEEVDAELGDVDTPEAPKSRFFCCSRGKKTDAEAVKEEVVEVVEPSAEVPESPGAYKDILEEAFSKAAAEEYTPRRSDFSEGENRVILSISGESENDEAEEQKQNGGVKA